MKISVLKIEIVNGKSIGKSVTLHLDPREMAKHKTEATVKKKIEEHLLKEHYFEKTDLPLLKYQNLKEFLAEWKKERDIRKVKEEEQRKQSLNGGSPRVTPAKITKLDRDQVFVFGSNATGAHGGGAAKYAARHFGAINGIGNGMQGQSYGIDSMSGLSELKKQAEHFAEYAEKHSELRFLVTPIGCGVAGYTSKQIAPLFAACRTLGNVSLPEAWWNILSKPHFSEVNYYLDRFLEAQEGDMADQWGYDKVLSELKNGEKTGHWIWYIFPQMKGLGHSARSFYYGLCDNDEAQAYLAHPVLGKRLRECCEALLEHTGKKSINEIMGNPIDVLKLQTSMNLFNRYAPNDVFAKVLDEFYKK